MYKKINDENIQSLLEAGTHEFAENGFDKANIAGIAKRSGLSVGVIYKYFGDKDGFFIACVRHCLTLLDEVLSRLVSDNNDVLGEMELVLRSLVEHARNHTDYYILYHEITAGGCRRFAKELADEIESVSAKTYSTLLEQAQRKGLVRADMNPKMFAFFFDNLLMMLQFSFSCDYYKERMRIYCDGIPDDESIVREMLKFMNAALGIG